MIAVLALVACKAPGPTETTTGPTATSQPGFVLPEDIADIDFVATFEEALRLMASVSTQQPWKGHQASLDNRVPGCPDFWTGTFTDGITEVGNDEGVSWWDDCLVDESLYFDGWIWWDFDVLEEGDPGSVEGRISDASRQLEGDAIVGNADGVQFEFDGEVSDSLYQVEGDGYTRTVYSTAMNATVTGSDVFEGTPIPGGYRTDMVMFYTGGDVDRIEARGNVYLFTPQLGERFDSIGADLALQGTLGAGPNDCTLEPLGWIGVRDPDAYWYDVVFLPRFQENIIGEPYENDPLSQCDGCGRLYVQGVEMTGMEVCVDFSFLFSEFPLPDPDDYVLPIHAL